MTGPGIEPVVRPEPGEAATTMIGEPGHFLEFQSLFLRLFVLTLTVCVAAWTARHDPPRALGICLVGWVLDNRIQVMLRAVLPTLVVGPHTIEHRSARPGASWSVRTQDIVGTTWIRCPNGTRRWDWTVVLVTATSRVEVRVRSAAGRVDAPWIDAETWEPLLGPFLAQEVRATFRPTARSPVTDPDGASLAALVQHIPPAARTTSAIQLPGVTLLTTPQGVRAWASGEERDPGPVEVARCPPDDLQLSWSDGPAVRFFAPIAAMLEPAPREAVSIDPVDGVALLHAIGWGGPPRRDVLSGPARGSEQDDQAPLRS